LKDVNDNHEIGQLRKIDIFLKIRSSSKKSDVQPEETVEQRIFDVAEQHQEMDHVNQATALTAAEPAVVTPAPLAGSGERSDEIFIILVITVLPSLVILQYVSTTLANLKMHVVCGYSVADWQY